MVDKLRYDLLPSDALAEVTRVLTIGADKHGAYDWEKGYPWHVYFSKTLRHLFKWWGGEENDTESGCSHLAHAACNILFLLAWGKRNVGTYDKRKGE